MAKKKTIKFDPTKDRVITFNRDGEKLSEINGELKSDFYSGIEKMCYLTDELCAFYKGKKMGVVNSKGEILTPAEWESIKYIDGLFKVSKKNKATKDISYGYVNFEGVELFDPYEYDSVNDVFDGRIVATSLDAGKECAFDLKGNLVIAPKYIVLDNFHHNVAAAAEEKGKVGLVDLMGNWVLPPEYSSISGFGGMDGLQNFCTIQKDGKYGLIDKDLKIVVEPKYDDIFSFDDSEGLKVVVGVGEKVGVVDADGNWLIPADYDRIYIMPEDHYIKLEKNYKYSLADMKGHIIIEGEQNVSMNYGLLLCSNGKEIKRTDGSIIFKGNNAKIFPDIILVSTDGKQWGIIDHDGKELLPQEYSLPTQFINRVRFSDGLLNLNGDNKCVYIDEKGEVKISLDCCGWAFYEGYAIIGQKADYSIVNASGEILAAHFAHIVNLGCGYFFINNEEENEPKILNVKNGEQMAIPARVVGDPVNGYIKIQAPDLKYGVISIADGKVILEPIYDKVLLTADGIWGYMPKEK